MSGSAVLSLFDRRQPLVYVDVGSAATKVIRSGQVIFHQPSLLVVDRAHENLIAMGTAASALSGKLTADLELVSIVVKGQLYDSTLFSLFMRGLQQKLERTWLDKTIGLPVAYSSNFASSAFTQKIWRQAWTNANWRVNRVIEKHQALHAALRRPFLCVVDHGADTTEIAVYHQDKLLLAQTLVLGGNRYTEIIRDTIRSQNGVAMSLANTELVKQKIGRVSVKDEGATDPSTKISIRASQAGARTHQTLVLHSDQFLTGLNQQVDELSQQLELCFNQLSKEAGTELGQHGAIFCGGASQLKGLAARVSAHLNFPITVAQNPELCLVKGMMALGAG